MLSSQSFHDICKNKLSIEQPKFRKMNKVMAQYIAGITSSLRLKSYLNCDLTDMESNLVPYPRINYMTSHISMVESPDSPQTDDSL